MKKLAWVIVDGFPFIGLAEPFLCPDDPRKFKLPLAQMAPILGDIRRTVAQHPKFATRTREAGASVVLFPELSLTGYNITDLNWDLAIIPEHPHECLRPLLSLRDDISIVVGGGC